jgi:hypothetical protein
MDNRTNTKGHYLRDIKEGIEKDRFYELSVIAISNEFRGENLVDYFKSHGFKIELEGDVYIFTSL